MYSAQVGVFEEADEVCLAGFLERHDSRALESEIGLEVLALYKCRDYDYYYDSRTHSPTPLILRLPILTINDNLPP